LAFKLPTNSLRRLSGQPSLPAMSCSRWLTSCPRTVGHARLLRVVADHEPVGAGFVVTVPDAAGCDGDLLDPQVPATVR